MEAISRAEARSRGLKRFFTGKPCIRGHVAERIVSNKACVECAAIRDRAYKDANRDLLREKAMARYAEGAAVRREYYLKNKDKYKERSDRRYREKRDEILAMQRKRFADNPGLSSDKNRKYRMKNPDSVSATQRNNYVRNRERILQRQRDAYLADPSKATAKAALRRSRRAQAVPSWFGELDAFVWQEAAHLVILRRDATGIDWAADHMIPLASRKACGLHVAANCQVIPAVLNGRKHNKMVLTMPDEWLASLNTW